MGTTQQETWASLLARAGLRVRNLSVTGATPWQEYVNLSLMPDSLKTREGSVVLWALFSGNDLDDHYYDMFDIRSLPWQGPGARLVQAHKSFRRRSPLQRILYRAGALRSVRDDVIIRELPGGRKVLFFAPYASIRRRTREDVLSHPHLPLLKKTFVAMKRLTDERGLRLSVAILPSKEEVYGWMLDGAQPWANDSEGSGFSDAVVGLCRELGVACLDLRPPLVEESRRVFEESGSLLWWDDDSHWNAEGHRVAAQAVYDGLLRPLSRAPFVNAPAGPRP